MEIWLANETLEFRLFVDNATPDVVTEISYPLVGGLRGEGRLQHGKNAVEAFVSR